MNGLVLNKNKEYEEEILLVADYWLGCYHLRV